MRQVLTDRLEAQHPIGVQPGRAHQTGFGDAQFTALIDIANVGPGLAQAYRMWRRDQIGEGGFRRAGVPCGK